MKRFVSDAAWSLSATIIDRFCGLITQAYLVRRLGIDSFGMYAAICALGQLASTSLSWNSGEIAIQALETSSRDNPNERRTTLAFLIGYDIRILGIGGLILAPVLWFTAPLFNVDRNVWLLAGLCFANISHASIRGVQTVENRWTHMGVHSILSTVLMALGTILLASMWEIKGALYGLLIGNVAKTWIGIGIERFYANSPWPTTKNILSEIIHPSHINQIIGSRSSSFARGILQQLLANGDTIAISVVSSPATIGLYKIARSAASAPGALISPIISVLRSRIVAAWSQVAISRLTRLMRHAILLSFCGSALGVIGAPIVAYIIAPKHAGRELMFASALMGAAFVLYQGLNTIHLIFAVLSRDDRNSIILQIEMSFILLSLVMITGNLGMTPLAVAATVAYSTGTALFIHYGFQTISLLKQKHSSSSSVKSR